MAVSLLASWMRSAKKKPRMRRCKLSSDPEVLLAVALLHLVLGKAMDAVMGKCQRRGYPGVVEEHKY